MSSEIIIYHNPACGTSRNTLALIRATGTEPMIVEYLQVPPDRKKLIQLIADAEISTRTLLREKGTSFQKLGLGDAALSDEVLIDAMMKHPILINRPLVETPMGVTLCRPSELVLQILAKGLSKDFVKEDGEVVAA
jgi:arsenate reductase (glutaredoxin)